MTRTALFLLAFLIPASAVSGERISGTNSYVLRQDTWQLGNGVYWRQDNVGTYQVASGALEPGFVQCIGAGFADGGGVTGEGICIFGLDDDTFTWAWQAHKDGPNTWQVVGATGKYSGMTGQGTSTTRVESEFRVLPHRVTDWEGEINLPN